MFELSALGFNPFFEAQLNEWPDDYLIPARIAIEHRGGYEVWSIHGAGLAKLTGRLHQELNEAKLPRAGDWVALKSAPEPNRTVFIERVFERQTVFLRGGAGQEARGQVVAANVDLVFVVCGLDADYNVRRIERYLTRIWASGAQPAIILSKADICETTAEQVAEVTARSPGVPVYATSVIHSDSIDAIRARIQPGLTAAFVGSSGTGKSTLINALVGEVRMAIGELRTKDGRGRHTTTRRQLVLLPEGGLLLDTPGMRELQLIDDEGIGATFPDIEELAQNCRYRDCRHSGEPGCAIEAAVSRRQAIGRTIRALSEVGAGSSRLCTPPRYIPEAQSEARVEKSAP